MISKFFYKKIDPTEEELNAAGMEGFRIVFVTTIPYVDMVNPSYDIVYMEYKL